jgi:hypothetical protein
MIKPNKGIIMQKSSLGLASCTLAAVVLTGCGGGGSDDSYTPPALQNGPGGHLFGFYAESPDVGDPNPEVGGIYVDAPNDEGRIKGRLSFRYFDCQAYNSNNLKIDGTKVTSYLAGKADGALDSISTNPDNKEILLAFDKLSYSRASNRYNGGYMLDQSNNDERSIANCNGIEQKFVVARKGAMTLYPADTVFPQSFNVSVNATTNLVSWSNTPSGVSKALVDVIDPNAIGDSSANGIVSQLPNVLVPSSAATDGKEYVVVVQLFDQNNAPLAFKQITAKL